MYLLSPQFLALTFCNHNNFEFEHSLGKQKGGSPHGCSSWSFGLVWFGLCLFVCLFICSQLSIVNAIRVVKKLVGYTISQDALQDKEGVIFINCILGSFWIHSWGRWCRASHSWRGVPIGVQQGKINWWAHGGFIPDGGAIMPGVGVALPIGGGGVPSPGEY